MRIRQKRSSASEKYFNDRSDRKRAVAFTLCEMMISLQKAPLRYCKGAKHLTREDRRIADTNPPMAGGQAVYAVCLPLRVQVVVLQSVTEA